jgi:hypothetical protein
VLSARSVIDRLPDRRFVPISEVNDSFDHVGERQQCRGNGNAERFRGFEIDHEGKLARPLDREIAGPGVGKADGRRIPGMGTCRPLMTIQRPRERLPRRRRPPVQRRDLLRSAEGVRRHEAPLHSTVLVDPSSHRIVQVIE